MLLEHAWVEKRKFERIDSVLKVDYSKISKQELDENLSQAAYSSTTSDKIPQLAKRSAVISAVTKDVSQGGLALLTEEEIDKEENVIVYLYLPDIPAPLTLLMEVARSGMASDGTYRSGLKILAINSDDVRKLDRYLLTQKLSQQEKNVEGKNKLI